MYYMYCMSQVLLSKHRKQSLLLIGLDVGGSKLRGGLHKVLH